jgi:serine/threonine protein kinase
LHHNKIIHRDIKPENLVFDEKGYLCLTDLGVARLDIQDNTLESSGTPGYMAPEIITNQPHDITSDYYSLGIMLYEIIFKKVLISLYIETL